MATLMDEIKRLNRSKKIKIRVNPLPEGNSLYLEFNKNYKRERQFLNLKVSSSNQLSKADVRTLYEAEMRRDMREFEIFNEKTFSLEQKITDADFMEYFQKVTQNTKLPSYKGSYKHLKNFIYLDSKSDYLPFSTISIQFCNKFKKYLQNLVNKKELANPTAKTYLTVFAATLNRAVNDKILFINPASKVRIKEIESKREYLSEEEVRSIIKVNTKYWEIKNAFLFSCQTSLRLGDIRKLKFADIRFSNKKTAEIYYRTSKTSKVINFKLSDLALSIYQDQKLKYPDRELVFNLPNSRSVLNENLRTIVKEAGITKHVSFHVSRHTFATLALSKGIDIYTVSKILGHTTVSTTEIYANLVDKKRDEVADRINIDITEEYRKGKK